MDTSLRTTVDTLLSKITAKESEANELKKLVNGLCRDAGESEPFPDVKDSSQGLSRLRSDQFYGQPLAAAMRTYLEMRKSAGQGAASVNDIYAAIKQGGFKFEAKDDENAKNGVRISLRKNSTIFHRLPNGEFGLSMWYPNAKAEKPEGDHESKKPKSARSGKLTRKETKSEDAFLTNDQIRTVIFSFPGEFKATDLEKALKEKHAGLAPRPTAIPSLLFQLKKKGQLKITKERSGSAGATFQKA